MYVMPAPQAVTLTGLSDHRESEIYPIHNCKLLSWKDKFL